VLLARRLVATAGPDFSTASAEAALSAVLTSAVTIVVEQTGGALADVTAPGSILGVRLRGVDAALWIEADLALAAVGRVVGAKAGLFVAARESDPVLHGALSAIVAEAARRAASEPPQVSSDPPTLGAALRVALTVFVDGKPYRAVVWAAPRVGTTAFPPRKPSLSAAELPVSLSVVAARCVVSRNDLATLAVGDVFVPDAWSATPAGAGLRGHVTVAAAAAERGARFSCSETGDLVLTRETEALSADPPSGAMADSTDTILENVLDAPVVVRIEVGTVTLTAREWTDLRPGDVIETGRRIAEPVVLRVAGREVARGELVDVDGEVGVRTRQIFGATEQT
jgi:type III secretion system YscQ/HrcQ family protein